VNYRLKFIAVALALMAAAIAVVGCDDVATTSASCAFIVHDSDTDKSVDDVIYPNQSGSEGDDKKTLYFPCNSRTYGINRGNKKNANDEKIGDRFTLAPGTTATGTDVLVSVTAYWTLNEDPNVLKNEFYNLCEKYGCWSEDPISNSANYADPGWNGMLGENMGEPIDRTVHRVTSEFSDALWQEGTQEEYDKLGERLSGEFAADVLVATGYNEDLFCGSGNSGWTDPNKPGKGEFTCTNVRFVVDDVVNEDHERQEQANEANGLSSQIEDNEKQLKAAKAKYGSQAEFWLGLQDYAEGCSAHCPPVYVPEGVIKAGN
jgi:hypothetical protein